MRLTSISTTEGMPAMPHHTEDGDNVRSYHVTPESQVEVYVRGSDTSRFESVDSDKQGTSSDVHLMTHAGREIQNLDEKIFLLPSQKSWVGMLGTALDYLAQIWPPATIIQDILRNESDRIRFSKFNCKRMPSNGEAAGHPCLLFLPGKT